MKEGPAERGGITIGTRTGTAMLAARAGDGAFGAEQFPVGSDPGQWRPVPPVFANSGAWTADLKPFSIRSTTAYRTAGPPARVWGGIHFRSAEVQGAHIGYQVSAEVYARSFS